MPNNTTAIWAGVRLPAKWRDEYARKYAETGVSIARQLLNEIAKARGEEVPPITHRTGGKVGRPRKKVTH